VGRVVWIGSFRTYFLVNQVGSFRPSTLRFASPPLGGPRRATLPLRDLPARFEIDGRDALPPFSDLYSRGDWTRGDLNPRPLLCESSDLPLIYVPAARRTGDAP
jgi:hypothetical protein